MSTNLFVTSSERYSGKSAIVLGLMQLLLKEIPKVAFFRPIIAQKQPEIPDNDINLIRSHFNLQQNYEQSYAFTLPQARHLINQGKNDELMETVLEKYKELEKKYDFVLVEGTDCSSSDPAFEADLNSAIAENIGAPTLFVVSGFDKTPEELAADAQLVLKTSEERNLHLFALVLNRVGLDERTGKLPEVSLKIKNPDMLLYTIPDERCLSRPSIEEVKDWLGASVLYGKDRLNALADDYLVAAMQASNFMGYIQQGSLVLVPGDRTDIILSCLVSRISTTYPDISGIVLTGGIKPSERLAQLIEGWREVPMAVLLVKDHTYKAAHKLNNLYGRIAPDNLPKISIALKHFESHVNTAELREKLVVVKTNKLTPKMFEFSLIERAQADKQHVVLPEGSSDRILQAADVLLKRGICNVTLLGDQKDVSARVGQLGLQLRDVQIIDPKESSWREEFAQTYFELRKHKGITMDMAYDQMLDNTYFATMMVHKQFADAMVSGSITTTAQTIRPALEIIKTRSGCSIVSSVFFMCLKDRVLVYGDCAVNPDPNAQQLAEIAVSSAQTARLFGVEPRVALLSYSTGGSGKGADVDKVREATKIAKDLAPDLPIEGPIQYDAAISPEVAKTKLPDSQVAGHATVFIVPDLNTGNIAYKAVQRAADAVAIGPVLQGLKKPVLDLSRGCSIPDIVNTVAIAAIQAQETRNIAYESTCH